MLQVLSFVAENERVNIRQRQREGIAAAMAQGVKFGRPPRPLPENFHEVHRAWRSRQLPLHKAAEACRLPVGTFYDKARKFEKAEKAKQDRIGMGIPPGFPPPAPSTNPKNMLQ